MSPSNSMAEHGITQLVKEQTPGAAWIWLRLTTSGDLEVIGQPKGQAR